MFDGHSGSECVNVVIKQIPNYIIQSLKNQTTLPSIASALKLAFNTLDADILGGVHGEKGVLPELPFDTLMNAFKPALSGACALVAVV